MTSQGDNGAGRTGDPGQPLDDLDEAILAGVRDLYGTADPPPADLTARVVFALALSNVEDEVARLRDEALAGAGPRGGPRARTLTFESAGLAVMITVTDLSGDRARVDGWLVPPGAGPVELRLEGGQAGAAGVTRTARADQAGRFVIASVRHGLAQLRVPPAVPGASGVVTASFTL